VKPPHGPVKIHRNCDFPPLQASISMVRSNSAGSHPAKYFRGAPGTVHLVRGEGAPGNSKPSPPAGDAFHGGRSTLAAFTGSLRSCAAASADTDSTAPENVRREKLFIEPPAAFVSHARLGQPHQPLPMGALGPAPMRSQSRDHSERLPAIEPVIS
jgi:hypothetical protein